MLIEQREFSGMQAFCDCMNNGSVYRYCSFFDVKAEGGEVSSVFLSCDFKRLNLYWPSFTCCLFVDSAFVDCVFYGALFSDCRFLNCKMSNCKFENDNLGGSCCFRELLWIGEGIENCVGFPVHMKE